jgi:PQQ system protein
MFVARLRRPSRRAAALLAFWGAFALASCNYGRLLRPNVLGQLNPNMARLVNELPGLDRPNDDMVGQIFAKGGLGHAKLGKDGIMRTKVRVPPLSFLWEPAIIVMERSGELELEFQNEDQAVHIAYLPNNGERQVLYLPAHTGGRARIRLDEPGLYWFGCPVANHAGRGMLGLIIVGGETPDTAKLDRPPQKRP